MPGPIQARPLASLPAAARAAAGAARRAGCRVQPGPARADLCGAVTFPETEGTGDLDYHAILARPPNPASAAALAAHEAEMARRHPRHGADLDGWVILLDDARRALPPSHLLRPELRDHSWALRRAHWPAGQCVVLHGPAPADIVPSKCGWAWWALDHLPAEHHPAIRAAMSSYRGEATGQETAALARGRAAIMTLAALSSAG